MFHKNEGRNLTHSTHGRYLILCCLNAMSVDAPEGDFEREARIDSDGGPAGRGRGRNLVQG